MTRRKCVVTNSACVSYVRNSQVHRCRLITTTTFVLVLRYEMNRVLIIHGEWLVGGECFLMSSRIRCLLVVRQI